MLICTSPHQESAVGRVANMVNCAILLVKSKGKGSNSLHYLAFGPTVQVLSTQWGDSSGEMGDSSLCIRHYCS